MSIGSNIRQLRESHGLTQSELGQIAGVSDKAVSTWEADLKIPRMGAVQRMADYFGLPKSAILDDSPETAAPNIPAGFEPLPAMVKVPLIGSIACGTPILAEENIESYIGIPAAWKADFALTCHGDSMAPMICDGDIVCIRKQAQVETGEVAAVRIGEEATLKRFYRYPDYILLRPENPEYDPIIKFGTAMNEVQIEGKAVGLCRGIGK